MNKVLSDPFLGSECHILSAQGIENNIFSISHLYFNGIGWQI